jgi:hypothetical protein
MPIAETFTGGNTPGVDIDIHAQVQGPDRLRMLLTVSNAQFTLHAMARYARR